MNAQQAREMQQEAMQLKEEKIKWQIENAAKKGRDYTWTDFMPSETTINNLKELGYTVQVNEKDVRISW